MSMYSYLGYNIEDLLYPLMYVLGGGGGYYGLAVCQRGCSHIIILETHLNLKKEKVSKMKN